MEKTNKHKVTAEKLLAEALEILDNQKYRLGMFELSRYSRIKVAAKEMNFIKTDEQDNVVTNS